MSTRVWGVRGSLIGDCIAALPVYACIRKHLPDAFTYWQVARKCAQVAPLFYNHPLINELVISDCNEGMGPRDIELAKSCGLVFNVMPSHPEGDGWPNHRNVYFETFRMSGLTDAQYADLSSDDQVPHLTQWFTLERRPKCIAIWPGARQGEVLNKRVPPYEWWADLCEALTLEGYTIYQCGHPNDLKDKPLLGIDARTLSFLEAVQLSLGCDLAIGTDSGSMIALAAYHSTPTISLLSLHWPNHTENPFAFGPLGKNHVNLWAPSNEAHSIDKVLDTVRQLA